MTHFQRFVRHLTYRIKKVKTGVTGCSSIELIACEKERAVFILLRTKPDFTKSMLAVQPFEFPWPMLLNTMMMVWQSLDYIKQGGVVPAPNELVRATLVNVIGGNRYGTTSDFNRKVLYVPIADLAVNEHKETYTPAEQWAVALLDASLPGVPGVEHKGIELFIVHLPDCVEILTDEQLTHIARLIVGWNYCRGYPEGHPQILMSIIKDLLPEAHTIVTYD